MNTDNHIDEKMLLDDERIVNYLKGKMTTNEEREFMQELQANPELKAKAIAMARMAKGMKEVGAANDEEIMGVFLAVDSDEIKTVAKDTSALEKKAKATTWHRTVTWLSAAASVALLIWAGIGYNDYRTTTELGNEYATVFTSSQLTRGGETPTEVEARLAMLFDNVVNGKDLKETLHDLTLCWEMSTQETYNDYTDFAPEIGWNLAICHLKDNDKKNAKAVLEKLIDVASSDTAIGNKVRELLKKVDEL